MTLGEITGILSKMLAISQHCVILLVMSQASYTKDEHYLVTAYKEEPDEEFDRYEVGEKARLSPKGVDTIVLQLIRGNFLRKRSENLVILTEVGKEVARSLLNQS